MNLTLSASQIETYELCPRKWWLESIRKLPRLTTDSQAFGTVLHAVCERYLRADDQGRDAAGKPVDLYPEGWHIARSRFGGGIEGEANPLEQDLLKRLIAAGIEHGLLERVPGRQIEVPFEEKVSDQIKIIGFIDFLATDTVQDHKTTKSIKYAKSADPDSPNYLGRNLQMLIYGHYVRAPLSVSLLLRHNLYVKDFDRPIVRKIEAQIGPQAIDKAWQNRIVPTCQQMLALAERAKCWSDVADPDNRVKTCNAYGGCPFLTICGGQEREEDFEARVKRVKNLRDHPEPEPEPIVKGTTMSIAEKLALAKARHAEMNKAAPAPKQLTPPPSPPPQASSVAVAATPSLCLPPWAITSCNACGGCGFSSVGKPCRICDARCEEAHKSKNFVLQTTGTGTVVWVSKTNDSICGESPLVRADNIAPPPPVEKQERHEPPTEMQQPPTKSVVETSASLQEDADEPAAEEEESPDEDEDEDEEPSVPEDQMPREVQAVEPPRVRGRPRKGWTLLINCVPVKGISKVIRLESVLAREGAKLAEKAGATNFYNLNAFERRDALCAMAQEISADFGTSMVLANVGDSPDLKALLAAIRPFAAAEIAGTL